MVDIPSNNKKQTDKQMDRKLKMINLSFMVISLIISSLCKVKSYTLLVLREPNQHLLHDLSLLSGN